MRRGRYERVPARVSRQSAGKHPKHRKLNKYFLVTLSLILVLGMGVGATVAYLIADSDTVTNTFSPGHVGCVVTGGTAQIGTNTYTVKPDSDTNTDVYLRATVVANWVDGAGNVYWQPPKIDSVSGENWSGSGIYYYGPMVAPDGAASPLTVTVSGTNPDANTYHLEIDVLGEAIQAEPSEAKADSWN